MSDARMTSADFAAWIAHMQKKRRWTMARCQRELGAGANQLPRWASSVQPPLYIGLACAALSRGLPVWRPGAPDSESDELEEIARRLAFCLETIEARLDVENYRQGR